MKATAEERYMERLADIFASLMNVVIHRSMAEVNADITIPQMECLKHLQRHGALSATELAEGLNVSAPAATKLVDRLQRRGLVQRRENPGDRRAVELSLTANGRMIVEQIRNHRSETLKTIIGRMNPEHRDGLASALEAFINAGLAETRAVDSLCQRCGDEWDHTCPLIPVFHDLTGNPMECK